MRDKVLELVNSYISKAIKNSNLDTAQAFDAFRDEFLVIYSQQTLKPTTEQLGFIPEHDFHTGSVNEMLASLGLIKFEVFNLVILEIKDRFKPGTLVSQANISECITHLYPDIAKYSIGKKPPLRPGNMALSGMFVNWAKENQASLGLEKIPGKNFIKFPGPYTLTHAERNGVHSLLKSLA